MSAVTAGLFSGGADPAQAAPDHSSPHGGDPSQTANPSQPGQAQVAPPAQTVEPPQVGNGPAADAVMIPKSRFDEVNGERRDAISFARQMEAERNQLLGYLRALQSSQPQPQQAQAPAEPTLPDLISDPHGYAQAIEERALKRAEQLAEERIRDAQRMTMRNSWELDDMRAVAKHGAEVVNAAKVWVQQNRLDAQLSQRADPYTTAVELYRVAQLRNAVPDGNLESFKERVVREAMSNPEVLKQLAPHLLQARPGVQPAPAVIPPPLSGQPRTNATAPSQMFSSGMEAVGALLASRQARHTP